MDKHSYVWLFNVHIRNFILLCHGFRPENPNNWRLYRNMGLFTFFRRIIHYNLFLLLKFLVQICCDSKRCLRLDKLLCILYHFFYYRISYWKLDPKYIASLYKSLLCLSNIKLLLKYFNIILYSFYIVLGLYVLWVCVTWQRNYFKSSWLKWSSFREPWWLWPYIFSLSCCILRYYYVYG